MKSRILSFWIAPLLLTLLGAPLAQAPLPEASEQVLGRFEAQIAQQVRRTGCAWSARAEA